jgi:hypothetical protein
LFLPNGSLNNFFLGLREEEAKPPVVLEGVWRCVFPEPVFLTDEALPGGAALAPGLTGLLEDLRGAGAAFFWAIVSDVNYSTYGLVQISTGWRPILWAAQSEVQLQRDRQPDSVFREDSLV